MKKTRPPSIPLIAENGKAENGKLTLFLKKGTTHPRVYPFGLHFSLRCHRLDDKIFRRFFAFLDSYC